MPTDRAMVMRTHDAPAASFLDLVEVYMAARLLPLVEPQALREQLRRVADVLGVDCHPLAQLRVLENASIVVPKTTGAAKARVLYLDDSERITDLSKDGSQLALYEVVKANASNVTFDAAGIASRLWPSGTSQPIVIDPRVAFGTPILDGTRIHTAEIAALVDSEQGDVGFVANLYKLSEATVRAAVEFETPGAAAA